MRKKTAKVIFQTLLVSSFFLLAFFITSVASAQNNTSINEQSLNIKYPVAELGGCQDEAVCKAYCDKGENMEACVSFAEKNGLMPKEEAERARKFSQIQTQGGLGGCKNKNECESYCSDVSRIDECVAFAEKNGLMSERELKEAKQVQNAVKNGVTQPGSCKNKKECDAYCGNPDNMEECLAFAEKAGLVSGEELADAKKVLPLMKKGEMPGKCKTKDACDAYCKDTSHANECADFAVKAGFMKPEEAEIFKKTGGKGPGGCDSKESCDAFCQNSENQQTCFNFGKENGLIPQEDLNRMEEGKQKFQEGLKMAPPEALSCIQSVVGPEKFAKMQTGGFLPDKNLGEQIRSCFEKNVPAGPGGCKSKEECDAFCSDRNNQETCFNFAKKNNLISEEQIQQMEQQRKEGNNQAGNMLNNAPTEVVSCLKEKLGEERFSKMQSGSFMPDRGTGDIMKSCFESFRPEQPRENQLNNNQPGQMQNSGPQGQPTSGFVGPGGCTDPNSCQNFCADEKNKEECVNFQSGQKNSLQPGMENLNQPMNIKKGEEEQFNQGQPGQFIQPGKPGEQNFQIENKQKLEQRPNMPINERKILNELKPGTNNSFSNDGQFIKVQQFEQENMMNQGGVQINNQNVPNNQIQQQEQTVVSPGINVTNQQIFQQQQNGGGMGPSPSTIDQPMFQQQQQPFSNPTSDFGSPTVSPNIQPQPSSAPAPNTVAPPPQERIGEVGGAALPTLWSLLFGR